MTNVRIILKRELAYMIHKEQGPFAAGEKYADLHTLLEMGILGNADRGVDNGNIVIQVSQGELPFEAILGIVAAGAELGMPADVEDLIYWLVIADDQMDNLLPEALQIDYGETPEGEDPPPPQTWRNRVHNHSKPVELKDGDWANNVEKLPGSVYALLYGLGYTNFVPTAQVPVLMKRDEE